MLQHATDFYGTVFKGGTATLMARVVGHDAVPPARADLADVQYSVFLLDDQNSDAREPIPGHHQLSLVVDEVIFDALQTNLPWDAAADPLGYNFRHTIDVREHAAFPIAGRRYLVEYRLSPVAEQVVLVRFRVHAI